MPLHLVKNSKSEILLTTSAIHKPLFYPGSRHHRRWKQFLPVPDGNPPELPGQGHGGAGHHLRRLRQARHLPGYPRNEVSGEVPYGDP